MDQGKKNTGDRSSLNDITSQGRGGLTFGTMLERFYLNQSPPDPFDPKFFPPVNLKERKQG